MIRLLIVDDSPLMRRLLADIFGPEPEFELRVARDGVEALAILHEFKPDVVTLDVHMPKMDGLACLDRIMLERPCPVVMLSSLTRDGADETLTALSLGAVDFVPKPAGALSLELDTFGPLLIDVVRNAAKSRVLRARRLTERVRLGVGRPAPPVLATKRTKPATGDDFGLVLVGCSTGGPPALDALLAPLPDHFPWAVLVAQHMPVGFTAALARRLDTFCPMRVVEVDRAMSIAPGHIYVGRGNADLVVSKRPTGLFAMCAPASA
ncbi:MAG: chemotaxis response regulator protein-glutamate methylesterase, partial [Hyphomicrobiales bacterium]|nr:chemotaxis response regulator protein-glutamate methylesterase [Hyphomicrobiales bacterium]